MLSEMIDRFNKEPSILSLTGRADIWGKVYVRVVNLCNLYCKSNCGGVIALLFL